GTQWLTIPVEVKGKFTQKIRETLISDPLWNLQHWRTLSHNFARAPFFQQYQEFFQELYLGAQERSLSAVNYRFLTAICSLLNIRTVIRWSMEFRVSEGKTQRLVDLCKQAGAVEYVSGPSAREYLDESLFVREGIRLRYMDYSGYPEYPQLFGPFEHGVSILDLLFNVGPEAPRFMKSF